MTLLSNPETPMHKIGSAIERDPAFAARLLHVANSAAYRPTKACCSIEEAVARLGSRSVFDIVVSVAALGTFTSMTKSGAKVRDHLVGVAAIARLLGLEWSNQTGAVFACGLLHDVGKLLLIQVGEIDYDALPAPLLNRADRSHLYELPLLGYDHATLGSYVLEHWRLPETFSNVVLLHHDPEQAAQSSPEVRTAVTLVRAADRLEYVFRLSPQLDEALIQDLAADPAVAQAGLDEAQLRKLWPSAITTINDLRRVI